MSVESLALSLLSLPAFQTRLDATIADSVAAQFPSLQRKPELLNLTHDWPYLLQCASLLAQARAPECEDASFRIAQHCVTHGPDARFRDAACIIFDTLTNKPSIHLAETRELVAPDLQRAPAAAIEDSMAPSGNGTAGCNW